MTSTLTEVVEPSPVFVDESGRRGRRLRGLGWVFGIAFVGLTLAMISGLLGTQSDAPSFSVPKTADTLPPGQYVDAPMPAPPGRAQRRKSAPHTAVPTTGGSSTVTTGPTATPTSGGLAGVPSASTGHSPTAGPHRTKPPASTGASAHPHHSPAPTHESPTPSAPPTPISGLPTGPTAPGTAP